MSARALELTLDSAQWPADFASAQKVKLRLPATPPPIDKQFRLRPDVLIAEADLRPSDIQDLAGQLAELRKAAGDFDIE